uniref:Uncharacterized protein n=1 Tax=Tetraselmis sp. GSL018 TaxID=582737 RepID=A0A061QN96_9CHLO
MARLHAGALHRCAEFGLGDGPAVAIDCGGDGPEVEGVVDEGHHGAEVLVPRRGRVEQLLVAALDDRGAAEAAARAPQPPSVEVASQRGVARHNDVRLRPTPRLEPAALNLREDRHVADGSRELREAVRRLPPSGSRHPGNRMRRSGVESHERARPAVVVARLARCPRLVVPPAVGSHDEALGAEEVVAGEVHADEVPVGAGLGVAYGPLPGDAHGAPLEGDSDHGGGVALEAQHPSAGGRPGRVHVARRLHRAKEGVVEVHGEVPLDVLVDHVPLAAGAAAPSPRPRARHR